MKIVALVLSSFTDNEFVPIVDIAYSGLGSHYGSDPSGGNLPSFIFSKKQKKRPNSQVEHHKL